ncbi:HNH endonuclease signature motif containing protein [Arthrobacter sp. NEB 688]|uniref:HNH endonuclease signature motif containing protein n=1 Tax=Arthrobacter sp. NEB 688 TaxID=904039 RepID=UPI00156620D3|nr:HNH endonuclease signature motif containing protein [Arthrobacter sp. NEB 688]QKE83889.1 HNH endonuclease [Arthrobacter sp. NEB 688]
MATGTGELEERRSLLKAATDALTDLDEALAAAPGDDLGDLMELLDTLAARASAARVQVTLEAVRRGEVAGSATHAWVRTHAPSLRQSGAAAVTRLALDVAADDTPTHRNDPGPDTPLGIVWAAVHDAHIDAHTGCAVLRETTRLAPLLESAALPTATSGLLALAAEYGPSVMRRLRPRLLAEHGHDGALEDLHTRLAAAARLSMPHVESGDLTEYQLWMTPAQAATLEAAIGPPSAPAPNDDTGEADLRPAGQRRVEALTVVCATATAHTTGAHDTDRGPDTTLHLTIPLADLTTTDTATPATTSDTGGLFATPTGTPARGAGTVLATTADGTLLTPETARRLGCDAALLVHLLGTRGEPLTLTRILRLFTRGQRRHLLLRDRGCTYPGCTAPAAWTRAHHVHHWADGGPTDITNAALLCERHHTHVHRRRLWAEVHQHPDDHGTHVTWDLTPHSYDRHLDTLEHPPDQADAVA